MFVSRVVPCELQAQPVTCLVHGGADAVTIRADTHGTGRSADRGDDSDHLPVAGHRSPLHGGAHVGYGPARVAIDRREPIRYVREGRNANPCGGDNGDARIPPRVLTAHVPSSPQDRIPVDDLLFSESFWPESAPARQCRHAPLRAPFVPASAAFHRRWSPTFVPIAARSRAVASGNQGGRNGRAPPVLASRLAFGFEEAGARSSHWFPSVALRSGTATAAVPERPAAMPALLWEAQCPQVGVTVWADCQPDARVDTRHSGGSGHERVHVELRHLRQVFDHTREAKRHVLQ